MTKAARFDRTRFQVSAAAEAASLILTGDTRTRWRRETEPFADMIIRELNLDRESVVIDYGVGIGRLARTIINKTQCTVIGVDASPDMLSHSVRYVNSPRYMTMPAPLYLESDFLDRATTGIFAVWTLQHCFDLKDILQKFVQVNVPVLVCDAKRRVVPIEGGGWADDRIRTIDEMQALFDYDRDLSGDVMPHMPDNYTGRFWCARFAGPRQDVKHIAHGA